VSSATVRTSWRDWKRWAISRIRTPQPGGSPPTRAIAFFVERLMGETELPLTEQRTIAHQFPRFGRMWISG